LKAHTTHAYTFVLKYSIILTFRLYFNDFDDARGALVDHGPVDTDDDVDRSGGSSGGNDGGGSGGGGAWLKRALALLRGMGGSGSVGVGGGGGGSRGGNRGGVGGSGGRVRLLLMRRNLIHTARDRLAAAERGVVSAGKRANDAVRKHKRHKALLTTTPTTSPTTTASDGVHSVTLSTALTPSTSSSSPAAVAQACEAAKAAAVAEQDAAKRGRWCECSCDLQFGSLHSAHANFTVYKRLNSLQPAAMQRMT
jgi:hypothetical protein